MKNQKIPDTPGISGTNPAATCMFNVPVEAGYDPESRETLDTTTNPSAPADNAADNAADSATQNAAQSTGEKTSPPQEPTGRRKAISGHLGLIILALGLILMFLLTLTVGRFYVPIQETVRILADRAFSLVGLEGLIRPTWTDQEATVILTVRLPRALLAVLVGAGLAISGAVLQALFRNPLVSPDVIGVSSGAAFGGVLAILLSSSGLVLMGSAFLWGIGAVAVVMSLGRLRSGSPVLMIVLGGIVVGAFFNAMVSFVTYVADPYETLPTITFWLMGSISGATWAKAALAAAIIVPAALIVLTLRWRINVLSLGDEDALALGVNPTRLRWVLIIGAAAMTGATVASVGTVGWVGLVIPHLARLSLGTDHRILLPASFLLGGMYLLFIDTLARVLTATEIPVGILTAIIGAPFFVYLLHKRKEDITSA